eukprot:362295-Chlamydomonas_euryale.AAC.4
MHSSHDWSTQPRNLQGWVIGRWCACEGGREGGLGGGPGAAEGTDVSVGVLVGVEHATRRGKEGGGLSRVDPPSSNAVDPPSSGAARGRSEGLCCGSAEVGTGRARAHGGGGDTCLGKEGVRPGSESGGVAGRGLGLRDHPPVCAPKVASRPPATQPPKAYRTRDRSALARHRVFRRARPANPRAPRRSPRLQAPCSGRETEDARLVARPLPLLEGPRGRGGF